MRRLLVVLAMAGLLAGCKADIVEIRISASDIVDAMNGKAVTLPFEASYQGFGELDAEQREKLEQIEEVAGRYLEIEDFDITAGDVYGSKIEIEGRLPLVHAANRGTSADSALVVTVESSGKFAGVGFPSRVTVAPTRDFEGLRAELEKIDYSATPEAVNPLKFRVRSDTGEEITLLLGGAQVGGEHFDLRMLTIADGDSATVTFEGGAYDKVSGAFLIDLPKVK